MKRHRIVAAIVLIQAIVLPILFGSLGGLDRAFVRVLQATLAILCVAVFAGKKWATWTTFALMAVQIPVIESDRMTWRVTAGSSASIGLLKSTSWMDSRVGLNPFSGYVFNGAIMRGPAERLLTDGREVSGAFMLNLAVVPAAVLLLGRRLAKAPGTANQPPQRNAGSRPSSGDSPASETPSSLGPRG
ncbi:hypothetical protein [Opitutus terrae]|uniref:hypothetical protein n=1 Tax=Opitutus terrae TaxID=107709 RepID=UPI0005D0EBE6|nr:hypothetical protein [Opitutus terrae]